MAPIKIEELEENGVEVGTTSRASRATAIVDFLKKNGKEAFTQTEIGKAVGIASTHANQVLRNLCEKKQVTRKKVTLAGGKQLIFYSISQKK